jgi:hypothetical protein
MAWHRSAVVFEGDIGFRHTELPAEPGFPDLQLFETDDPGHATHPGKAVGVIDGSIIAWDPQTLFELFPPG